MKQSHSVTPYHFGRGVLNQLSKILDERFSSDSRSCVYLIDHFFRDLNLLNRLPISVGRDKILFINTDEEPSTDFVDGITDQIRSLFGELPSCLIGIGGGSTLDVAKATSLLLTNGGRAEDYQGWDLVKKPGLYKIGISSLSGTGAEATRTCVMMNKKKNLKLGMNSDFTPFDEILLDPDLTKTVSREQYFFTGLDTYCHAVESLSGTHRHAIADSFSREAVRLCEEVFLSEDMQSEENREKMMAASYLGGSAIAHSCVGIVHPLSAALSVVLGLHHGLANCIVMNGMKEFYPKAAQIFQAMKERQKVSLPEGVCRNLKEEDKRRLYLATLVHERPLKNALGENYREILCFDKAQELFDRM